MAEKRKKRGRKEGEGIEGMEGDGEGTTPKSKILYKSLGSGFLILGLFSPTDDI